MNARPMVTVVDDDLSVRESLLGLMRSVGYSAQAFDSAEAFLASGAATRTECLILDVRMRGMSGPELHRTLSSGARRIPVVFVTAFGDGPLRERLLAAGALECLPKPFDEEALLDAVRRGLEGGLHAGS